MPQDFLASVPPEHQPEVKRQLQAMQAAPPHVQSMVANSAAQFVQGASSAGLDWDKIKILLPVILDCFQRLISAARAPQGLPGDDDEG